MVARAGAKGGNMAAALVNLTSRAIFLALPNGERVTVPPSGTVARIAFVPGDLGRTTFGEVENLPAPQPGKVFVVSPIVGSALGGSRSDVLCPGTGLFAGLITREFKR